MHERLFSSLEKTLRVDGVVPFSNHDLQSMHYIRLCSRLRAHLWCWGCVKVMTENFVVFSNIWRPTAWAFGSPPGATTNQRRVVSHETNVRGQIFVCRPSKDFVTLSSPHFCRASSHKPLLSPPSIAVVLTSNAMKPY